MLHWNPYHTSLEESAQHAVTLSRTVMVEWTECSLWSIHKASFTPCSMCMMLAKMRLSTSGVLGTQQCHTTARIILCLIAMFITMRYEPFDSQLNCLAGTYSMWLQTKKKCHVNLFKHVQQMAGSQLLCRSSPFLASMLFLMDAREVRVKNIFAEAQTKPY